MNNNADVELSEWTNDYLSRLRGETYNNISKLSSQANVTNLGINPQLDVDLTSTQPEVVELGNLANQMGGKIKLVKFRQIVNKPHKSEFNIEQDKNINNIATRSVIT